MKKRIACLGSGMIIVCMSAIFARAAADFAWPDRGKRVDDFLPSGYFIRSQAEADFNGDKRRDLVLVLQKKGEKGEIEGTPRWLVILFKEAAGSYLLSLKSPKAVPGCGSGLRAEEEFAGPWIVGNTFKIRSGFSDGHRGVTTEYQFRFQDSDWYLIGSKSEYLGEVGRPDLQMDKEIGWSSRVVDNNYLTGNRIETWSCGSCDDPEIALTLKFHNGEYAKTLQDYFEKSDRENGGDSLKVKEKN
jgi:hypothetical protein